MQRNLSFMKLHAYEREATEALSRIILEKFILIAWNVYNETHPSVCISFAEKTIFTL